MGIDGTLEGIGEAGCCRRAEDGFTGRLAGTWVIFLEKGYAVV